MKYTFILVFALMAHLLTAQNTPGKKYISAEDLGSWVGYLASDNMKGRMNGSDEMAEAAGWIASRYKEFGLKAFKEFDSYLQPYSFSRRDISVNEHNVLGYIPGTDPKLKDEYIIISAHFDHIGIRKAVEGDSIYNGADDNAAGTSTLLGVAKAISMSGKKPGRTIVFTAVSGEEMGLHGSRYFVSNPTIDLSKAFVNINFEMTGHSEELGKGSYYMTGCDFSTLDDCIKGFNRDRNITLVDTIAVAGRLFFASDNIAFARVKTEGDISYGIPCGTFATTTMGSHIHKPNDELELFDLENMAELVNYFSEMVMWLSWSNESVEWTNNSFKRLK